MKPTRSTVGKGMKLGTKVEGQRKGKGAYIRKGRYNRWEYLGKHLGSVTKHTKKA